MLEQNNKWRNKFNTSSLGEEDWLEPSDKLFAAIEEEIYEEKKERRFVPWLLLGFVLVSVIGYLTFSTFSNSKKDALSEANSDTSISIISEAAKTDLESSSTDEAITTALESPADTKDTEPSQDFAPAQRPNINNKLDRIKETKVSSSAFQSSGAGLTQAKKAFNKNQIAKRPKPIGLSSSVSGASSSFVNKKAGAKKTAKTNKLISFIGFLPVLENSLLGQQGLSLSEANAYIEKTLDSESLAHTEENDRHKITNGFYVNAGANFTRFVLNQNFSSAVDPADFEHSWGTGYAVTAGYKKQFGEKLGLFVEMDYTRNTFTSGHNSAYTYDLPSEQNASQEANLTMATPLGFMEGSVLLLRTATVTESEVGLVLDLHNEHKYSTAGINLGLAYELLSFSDFDLALNLGLGVQRLFDLSNTLTEVNTSNTGFGSTMKNITSDQQTIRKSLPKSVIGFDLMRDFCPHSRIGLSYRYHQGLKAIHAQGDLSTGVSEHRVQLQLLKDF